MSKRHSKILGKCAFIFLLFVSACTHIYKQPIHTVNLTQTNDKLPLSVELLITDELRNAKLEEHYAGDTFIVPLGENLIYQSEKLMNNVFSFV